MMYDMKKLFWVIFTLLFCIGIYAKKEEDKGRILLNGAGNLVSTNPVFVTQNGNVLTTVFNTNMHATIVVSKATAGYYRSVSTPEVVSIQTVDAQEFDEVTTIINNPEDGTKYTIQLITPEGTLIGEFEIKNED